MVEASITYFGVEFFVENDFDEELGVGVNDALVGSNEVTVGARGLDLEHDLDLRLVDQSEPRSCLGTLTFGRSLGDERNKGRGVDGDKLGPILFRHIDFK